MSEGFQALTEKEKQALRLLGRGHDAKSTARDLGISVHTVNERLREARRKMSVSSSREAARRLLADESGGPDFLTDRSFGDARRPTAMTRRESRATFRQAWIVGGVLLVSIVLATLALSSMAPVAGHFAAPSQPATPAPAAVVVDTEVVRSAQAWLALVDQGRWNESWEATGPAFHALNTSERWAAISEVVRTPLGKVISRTVISQERVPTPPHGYEIVRFRTSFAGRPQAVETVSLTRDGGMWKVEGYWIA